MVSATGVRELGCILTEVPAEPTTGMMDAAGLLYEAGSRPALAMFADAHNSNYYINSDRTQMNPTMNTVPEELLAGVRRLPARYYRGYLG